MLYKHFYFKFLHKVCLLIYITHPGFPMMQSLVLDHTVNGVIMTSEK
jgi:hypothetical protein